MQDLPRMSLGCLLVGFVLTFLTSCLGTEPVASNEQKTIWGADDRRDWREVEAGLAEFGRRHVGVLARRTSLGVRATPRDAQLITGRTRWEQGFCDDQPFLCQPRVGYCSGTLLDGDLFATAGHCLGIRTPEDPPTPAQRTELLERLQTWCDNTMVVFNWLEVDREPAPTNLPSGETGGEVPPIVTERDVYYCHEVLVHQYNPLLSGVNAASSDVTLFTLKRDPNASVSQPVVAPYGAAPVMANPRQLPSVAEGTEVLGIGFPAGLPMKFKTSPLNDLSPLWADTEMDILGGDSGGGLFTGSDRRHFAVLSEGVTECPSGLPDGHYCTRNEDDPATSCLIDTQGDSPGRRATRYSLTYRAIDVLCGGAGTVAPGGPSSTSDVFATRDTAYPSYLCGTAPPVAPEPYVPSPVEPEPVEPEPTEPGGDDLVTATGCAASGSARGLSLPLLFVLGLLGLRRRSRVVLFASVCVLNAACSGSAPDDDDVRVEPEMDAGEADTGVSLVGEDAEYRHVVSFVRLPRSPDALGLDLDEDGTIDSTLGDVVALFDELGISLSRALTRAVDDGRLRLLLQTRRERGVVDLVVHEGEPEPLDPSGGGIYTNATDVAPTTFTGVAVGESGFAVRAETFVLRIPIVERVAPLELPLQGARLEGTSGGWFFEGRLGGAIPTSALRGGLFAPLVELFDALLASDPGCPADCESASLGLALETMDVDEDGELSIDELEGFEPLAARLVPDLDTDGDGVADALSFGVELEAVQATFAPNVRAFSGGVPKALICFDDCSDATDCAACNARSECGWCAGDGLCVSRARSADCEMGGGTWVDRITQCEDCESRATCGECIGRNAFCGWCPGMGCVGDSAAAETACGADYRRFADGCE